MHLRPENTDDWWPVGWSGLLCCTRGLHEVLVMGDQAASSLWMPQAPARPERCPGEPGWGNCLVPFIQPPCPGQLTSPPSSPRLHLHSTQQGELTPSPESWLHSGCHRPLWSSGMRGTSRIGHISMGGGDNIALDPEPIVIGDCIIQGVVEGSGP